MTTQCVGCGREPNRGHENNCKYFTGEENLEYIELKGDNCSFCGVQKVLPHKEGCQELHRPTPLKTKEKPLTVSISAFDKQVGGLHYKGFTIEPLEFIIKNKLSFTQGNIIKRICRYNRPGGKGLEDLEKIIHELQCLIELDYAGLK